ncbi:MAG: hypothetical protein LBT75_01800 [Bacilli bacterium]|jgi:major membrane immunogen (membrane-anchored lipoprotein)|nr:hypothetical protein [Bacilli bacterium]
MKNNMTRILLIITLMIVSACQHQTIQEDGHYHAMEQYPINKWSTYISYDIKDGKITNFKYDAINLQEGLSKTKAQYAQAGKYLMHAPQGEWYKQARAIEKYLIDNNGDLAKVSFKQDGTSDAISGATIHWQNLPELLKTAQANGPSLKGSLIDGIYYKKMIKADEEGFTSTFGYFVDNGTIIGAHADAYGLFKNVPQEDGTKKDTILFKSDASKMNPSLFDLGNIALANYAQQANEVDNYFIKNNNFNKITIDEKGNPDTIVGATINISDWLLLAKEAQKIN